MFRTLVRNLLRLLYRVEIHGQGYFQSIQGNLLVVANHTSFLDPVLLWAFLPGFLTFAINTRIAQVPWIRPFLKMARVFPLDPSNSTSLKALIQHLRQGERTVIFPEGRITVTGTLMKIYDGAGMVADKGEAVVLPICIEGAQYTRFSKLKGRVRRRWFPKIQLHVLPPVDIRPPASVKGAERRKQAGSRLADVMTEMLFVTSNSHKTLFSALLDAKHIHGAGKRILEDSNRRPLHYRGLIKQVMALALVLERSVPANAVVGILLPGSIATVALMLAAQLGNRLPAMLNYTAGLKGLKSACKCAGIQVLFTSRRFVAAMQLEETLDVLAENGVKIVILEDELAGLSLIDRIRAMAYSWLTDLLYRPSPEACEGPAVILFTSGSEGEPKAVLLSHRNILANCAQLASVIDFNRQDVILNVLPLFHVFGLSAGTILPLVSGLYTFLYPNPLHYKVVPELAYDINATVLFGTNTFLSGYGKHAHPYDFYSVRYVFAGAEKLQENVRRLWMDKFGIRILEGYGATETSPVLAVNTPMAYRAGTVGRILPGIECRLEAVAGIQKGGRLHVKGPNVMLGYFMPENPCRLVPTHSCFGKGWYDSGDIVTIDSDGFVTIQGRAKRFAKVGGEMVSLAVVESLAAQRWPDKTHAAVAISDPAKGETILLVTDQSGAKVEDLRQIARQQGIPELWLPRGILELESLPLMGSGKIDFPALQQQVLEKLKAMA